MEVIGRCGTQGAGSQTLINQSFRGSHFLRKPSVSGSLKFKAWQELWQGSTFMPSLLVACRHTCTQATCGENVILGLGSTKHSTFLKGGECECVCVWGVTHICNGPLFGRQSALPVPSLGVRSEDRALNMDSSSSSRSSRPEQPSSPRAKSRHITFPIWDPTPKTEQHSAIKVFF